MCSLYKILPFLGALAQIVTGESPASSGDAPGFKSIMLRTHSLFPPYLDHDIQSRWFDFGGDTVINTNKHIRLTHDRPGQSGWLFSRLPLSATNFEIEVTFKISGSSTGVYGDGFALWITKERAVQGPVFGFVDKFEGLGVFFDTYKNSRPGQFPLVLAMLGDGKTPYDAAHDGLANDIGSCSARGIRGADIPTKARLTYYKDNYLELELQYQKEGDWTSCFNIKNVNLPPVSYLGFTALTGEVSDNHDIINVSSRNIYSIPDPGSLPKRPAKKIPLEVSKNGSWGWFLVKLFFFIAVCVGGYIGFTAWRVQQKRSRF